MPSIQSNAQSSKSGAQKAPSQSVNKKDNRTQVRVYTMKAVEDHTTNDVILGMFILFENPMCALIDPDSTYFYICKRLSLLDGLRLDTLGYDIFVTSP